MSPAPPRPLVALYEWTTYLMPASYREQHGGDQVRLFERVWREECPSGSFARVWWATGLLGLAVFAAATPTSVVIQVVCEQMTAVFIGLVAGAGAAAWALGLIKSWLYQLTPADPRVWSAALVCLVAMAMIGILIPAIRASRIDPLKALRVE